MKGLARNAHKVAGIFITAHIAYETSHADGQKGLGIDSCVFNLI
jgi:hypothetical protein